MSCCDLESPATDCGAAVPDDSFGRAERRSRVRVDAEGRAHCLLSVPGISCGGCISAVERALNECDTVVAARANLTLRQASITLRAPDCDPLPALEKLDAVGYPATLIDAAQPEEGAEARRASSLLTCLAVAGFGAANVMLLSVSVWAGAEGASRDAFHLLSALIALPVAAFAGRPFFGSALSALRARRLNMDVPISLAVLLALGLSVFETARGGSHVFYDAALVLLFFLLIGRYLDQLMRAKARSAVTALARLAAKGAMREAPDGTTAYLALDAIEPGMILRISPGERVPVDGSILGGTTDLDRSLVTGEHAPSPAGPGTRIEAGVLNLTGSLRVRVDRPAEDSFLAEVTRMLQAAERSRGEYVRIADRAARLYAPVVHLLAGLTLAGWVAATGDWQRSVFVAISVLIITCPCALGLAVPVVHVVAAGRLFREGIMMKDGSALERLATIDTVVFDKTGTLTTGTPRVTSGGPAGAEDRAVAGALAARSLHPASKAIAADLGAQSATLERVREVPGCGIEAVADGRLARLGRPEWAAEIAGRDATDVGGPAFAREGGPVSAFALSETLRTGARGAVSVFRDAGLRVQLLSGDGRAAAEKIAQEVGIEDVQYGATPAEKIARLEDLRRAGRRALMIGDGLNDAAALAAAHVSAAPGSASDVGRLAADFVFTRDDLTAAATAHRIAGRAARLVAQNFWLAVLYNCIAIPLAVSGVVTPLVAAIAMSASSVVVVGNSLRFPGVRPELVPSRPESEEAYA